MVTWYNKIKPNMMQLEYRKQYNKYIIKSNSCAIRVLCVGSNVSLTGPDTKMYLAGEIEVPKVRSYTGLPKVVVDISLFC